MFKKKTHIRKEPKNWRQIFRRHYTLFFTYYGRIVCLDNEYVYWPSYGKCWRNHQTIQETRENIGYNDDLRRDYQEHKHAMKFTRGARCKLPTVYDDEYISRTNCRCWKDVSKKRKQWMKE